MSYSVPTTFQRYAKKSQGFKKTPAEGRGQPSTNWEERQESEEFRADYITLSANSAIHTYHAR